MVDRDETGKAAQRQEAGRKAYFARAASWAEDSQEALRSSRRLAWIACAVLAAIAVTQALAIMLMMPLKTVEPYTLLVDRTTGYAQLLKGMDRQALTPDQALTQSLLAQYVIAREGFDITSVQFDYRKVGLWSAETARSDYQAMMPASNPASPFQRYPRTTIVTTRIKSISPLSANTAQVRFETERKDQGQVAGPRQAWVSIVRFRFVDAPMAMEDRLINPLGFQVLRYRRDQEALPDDLPPVPAALPQSPTTATMASPALNRATAP